jgi:hypothetical protein
MRSLYTLLCVAKSLATLGCMDILTYTKEQAERAGGKSWLCGQKFTQDFIFKIHLFLENVLQNLVRSTSKSVTFRCFCYF